MFLFALVPARRYVWGPVPLCFECIKVFPKSVCVFLCFGCKRRIRIDVTSVATLKFVCVLGA